MFCEFRSILETIRSHDPISYAYKPSTYALIILYKMYTFMDINITEMLLSLGTAPAPCIRGMHQRTSRMGIEIEDPLYIIIGRHSCISYRFPLLPHTLLT